MIRSLALSGHLDWRRIVVVLLTIGLTVFLTLRIAKGVDLYELIEVLRGIEKQHYVWMALTILLLVPNWLLEALKLKQILSLTATTSLSACLKSVVTGVTLGLVTPARLGEYGGRVIAFKKERRVEVLSSTVVTSLSQMTVTLFIGMISALVLLREYQFLTEKWVIISGLVCIGLLSLTLVFRSDLVNGIAQFPLIKGKNSIELWQRLSSKTLVIVLGLSLLRYGIYAVQFLLVLWALGIEISVYLLFFHIPLIFLLQTILPLPPIASIVGRASAAVIVLSQLGLSDMLILTASSIVWVINLVLPAFLGLGLIWKSVTLKRDETTS